MMKNKVSVVIPSFNALPLLKKNLPAVTDSLRNNDELILIDDAGTDGSSKWFIKEFSCKSKEDKKDYQLYSGSFKKKNKQIDIVLIKNKTNERFAKCVNRGIKEASGAYIFLLNNDVIPNKNVLKFLLPHFTNDKKNTLFAVSCHEQNKEGMSGGKNKLWFEKGMFIHSRADNFKTGETAWAPGGSSLFSKKKWGELKGMSLDYHPAYWEDTDLSFRARKKGWKIMFEEDAKVKHFHETTNIDIFGKKRIEKISWRNSIIFLWKHANIWQKISHIIWKPYWMIVRS